MKKLLFLFSLLFFTRGDFILYSGTGALQNCDNWSWGINLSFKSNPKTSINALSVSYPANTNQYPGFYANIKTALQKSAYKYLNMTIYSTVTPKLQICFKSTSSQSPCDPVPFAKCLASQVCQVSVAISAVSVSELAGVVIQTTDDKYAQTIYFDKMGFISADSTPSPTPSPALLLGKTTRYWDCCKPSCSWPGKANFTAPVRNCKVDGLTSTSNNDQSGCNGGPAYICTNQQPFSVNSNLAYGFAAGKLKNQVESDWCCGCYEMTFDGTDNQGGSSAQLIKGKRLVVQVTNTGGDLGDNHFDLQIPGGGVGIFNGCTAEYGAPTDGWGQRYGGVSSESQCSTLPSSLQNGCKFRFGFMGGADNPNVQFRRVYCPKELVDITLCRRNDDDSYPKIVV